MLTRLAAAALLLLVAGSPAWAQMPPAADNMIQGAYDDVARLESQLNSSPRAATAKRLLRMLSLTEQRLAASQNQADPSFKAANEAVANLKAQLTAVAEGKPMPSAPPAGAGGAPATASGNPVVQQATADLARISGEVDQMRPGDKAAGNKYMGELKQVGDALRGVADKDAAWSEAATTYNALQKRVVDVANATAPAGSQPAAPAGDAKPDPKVAQVMHKLEFTAQRIEQMAPTSEKTEKLVMQDLNWAADMLEQVRDRSHPSWQEAVDFREKLYMQLVTKRLTGIGERFQSVQDDIDAADTKAFVDTDIGKKATAYVELYAKELAPYEAMRDKPALFADAPEAFAVFKRPDELLALIDKRTAAARAQRADAESDLGDIESQVAAIRERSKASLLPQSLNGREVTTQTVGAYVTAMRQAQATMAQDVAYLEKVKASQSTRVDAQDLDRLIRYIGVDMDRRAGELQAEARAMLDGVAADVQRKLEFHAADDPNDPNHQANRFLGENNYEQNVAAFEMAIDRLKAAMLFEAAFGPDQKAERQAMIADVEKALAKFKDDRDVALKEVRLGKGVGDDELRQIGREVLTSGRYEGIGEIMRIETTKKSHRQETRSDVTGTVTGATVTSYNYEWDEFQASTVEKHGDRFIIYYSTIKYFYSGGPKTPLDRWLLSGRFASTPILEENIDK